MRRASSSHSVGVRPVWAFRMRWVRFGPSGWCVRFGRLVGARLAGNRANFGGQLSRDDMLCQLGVFNLSSWVKLARDSSVWTIFLRVSQHFEKSFAAMGQLAVQ